jgi:hypothetical protein
VLIVAALVRTGSGLIWTLVDFSKSPLLQSYEWMLIAKLAIVASALAIATYNKFRLTPWLGLIHRHIGWADEPVAPDAKTEAAATHLPPKRDDVAAKEVTSAPIVSTHKLPFKPPAGYKLKRIDGREVYCAKLALDGSRFKSEVCRTEAELRDMERMNQSMKNELDRRQRACESIGCMR